MTYEIVTPYFFSSVLGGTVYLERGLQQGVGDQFGPARRARQADRCRHGASSMARLRVHAHGPAPGLQGVPANPGEVTLRNRHQHVSSG